MGFVAAVLAGGLSAALLLIALNHVGKPLFSIGYFTILPLYLIGLGVGTLASVVAAAAGMIALVTTQPASMAFSYIAIIGLPAIGLTALALRYRIGVDQKAHWYPEGYLLTAITLFPSAAFLAGVAFYSTYKGGLLALTTETLIAGADQFAAQFPPDQIEAFHLMMGIIAKIMPMLAASIWILVTVITIGGAQQILQKQKWNLRDGFSITALHMPTWLIYAVAATGLVGVLSPAPFDYIGLNLSLILGLPFFFVGLAVFHSFAATFRRSWIPLFVFYALLTVLPMMLLVVAGLGIIDQWADFRQRFARNTTV